MSGKEIEARALRAILAELGATSAKARELVESGRASYSGADPPGTLATLTELVQASDILGKTAHRVLGHVPDASDYQSSAGASEHPPAPPPAPEVDTLLTRLTFLREHIVSTIDQQGAEVWQRPAEDGRPLQAYAEELAQADTALLARLREVTRP
jgi:hypothetical protein